MERRSEEFEDEKARFKCLFGDITKKRCYVLISSPICEPSPSLSYITCVPWVRVFDFDKNSDSHGLFCWASKTLSRRTLIKTNTQNVIEVIHHDTINWISITGDTECLRRQNRVSTDIISRTAVWRHGDSLADYCMGRKVPTILVMWYPPDSDLDEALEKFLSGMIHHLDGKLGSFQCVVAVNSERGKKSSLYKILKRLELINNIIVVPVHTLCNWMKELDEYNGDSATRSLSKSLPKLSDDGHDGAFCEIAEQDLQWIRSNIYILVKHQTTDCVGNDKSLNALAMSFLRGCRIPWDVLESGLYDVDRDLLSEVKRHIETKHFSTGRSGVVTILHAPGGGGTTFGRRLLHELRNQAPCGEIISERFSMKNLEERLSVIRDLTFLPTVLLLDGNSMSDVKRILAMETKIMFVLIHVKRYVNKKSQKPINNNNKFFLEARVSATESEKFTKVYSHAVPEKSGKLKKLSKECKKEKPHYIFEYGMTAFQSQFVGVRQYVHGYLQLHGDKPIKNWHRVLVFLSLANYYGHRSLPCKLFSKLLDKHQNQLVEMEDLDSAAQQFITEEDEKWKITHYVVSKLIIEQVLVRRKTTEYDCLDDCLSSDACKQLSVWALEFLTYISEYVGVSQSLAQHINEIVTAIFIHRNYDDPGETEIGTKTHYSKIIEEIQNAVEQKTIFLKLVQSFPGQAEFKAHLGRFYSKQGEFDDADTCFKEAISVRLREITGSNSFIIRRLESIRPDDVMGRIYNMSGFACLSNIRSRIGVGIGRLTAQILQNKSNLPKLIRFCLGKGDEGIKAFEKGRMYHHKSMNPSVANVGELKIRLQLSEFAKYICEDDFTALLSRTPPYSDLADFALKSFHECDRLLAECIADRSRDFKVAESEINFCINNYNFFFKNATEALANWAGDDNSMHAMKCRLSILKVKLRQEDSATGRKTFKLNEDVKNMEDIMTMVQLHEKICESIWSYNLPVRISGYMMEWLKAIRHHCMGRKYSQADVLARVEKWCECRERGSLSDFYRYLLTTTMSISAINSRDLSNTYAERSHKFRETIRSNNEMPVYAADNSEWLGKHSHQDFDRLIHVTDLGEWKGKFLADSDKISRLHVCSGYIQHCRPYDGIIILDGDRNVKINVFFVPNRYGISPLHSKRGTRVEFYLAFNTRHLAEAYEVTFLKAYPCPNCELPNEIPTLGKNSDAKSVLCRVCETTVRAID